HGNECSPAARTGDTDTSFRAWAGKEDRPAVGGNRFAPPAWLCRSAVDRCFTQHCPASRKRNSDCHRRLRGGGDSHRALAGRTGTGQSFDASPGDGVPSPGAGHGAGKRRFPYTKANDRSGDPALHGCESADADPVQHLAKTSAGSLYRTKKRRAQAACRLRIRTRTIKPIVFLSVSYPPRLRLPFASILSTSPSLI